jgi:hypothetical protein
LFLQGRWEPGSYREKVVMMPTTLRYCAIPLVFSLISSGAANACDAGGHWSLVQSNGATVDLELHQRGVVFSGTAYESDIGTGRVSGSTQGNSLAFDVYWSNGSVGNYSGRIRGDGYVHHGFTYDRSFPESRAVWRSTTPLNCGEN